MAGESRFAALVADGRPTGEVTAVNRTLVTVKGLEGVGVNALVLFATGDRGLVRSIDDQLVTLLGLADREVPPGTLAVLEDSVYHTIVGPELIGRVVNVLGQPLDGQGPITGRTRAAVFQPAPGVIKRQTLDTQLVTGVAIVDALFSVALGQRIAVLGDAKSGKSTFLHQLTQSQAGSDRVIIHVLIAKKQADIDTLLEHLRTSGLLQQAIVVVSGGFEALSLAYLAPYVGCAIGEHLWKSGRHTIMIYDDLTTHAKVYRELSLLARTAPGRNSYPGDMFHAHASLLERAGKLAEGGGTQTAIPVVATPDDDITAYLPTNIMSITDGQLIFDLTSFRRGIRPAVNAGLSVSRVGGRVQTAAWKSLSDTIVHHLADYRRALEFAHFGSEVSPQLQADLALGQALYDVFRQPPGEVYPLAAQYLMLAAVLAAGNRIALDVARLKAQALALAVKAGPGTDLTPLVDQLLGQAVPAQAGPAGKTPANRPATETKP